MKFINYVQCRKNGNYMKKQYEDFAFVYDELMSEVPYEQWIAFIKSVFDQSETNIQLVADLGCGTGNVTIPLAQSGYDMIGIDLSENMLMISRQKAEEAGVNPLFLLQDITEFELYGTVDGVIAACDSLNYLSSKEKILDVFLLVKNYLNEGGIFIFDVNTEYVFEKVYGNQTFTYRDEDVAYIWENTYDKKKQSNTYDISFFVRDDEENYVRFDEYHNEYAYGQATLEALILEAGLTLQAVYDNYSWKLPQENTERLTFIVKK